MARMTKTQIEYIRAKLNRKVNELVTKFKKETMVESSVQIERDCSMRNFVEWFKKNATKTEIINAMDLDGQVLFSSVSAHEKNAEGQWSNDITIDKVARSMKYNEASFKFLRSVKALTRVEALENGLRGVSKERARLTVETEKILDQVVFAGSPDGLTALIEKFLSK